MFGIREDLLVSLDGIDPGALLESWRWLVPDTLQPWFATALGDLFLRDADGRVWWLDVGMGAVECLAGDEQEFEELLSDADNRTVLFGEAFVDALAEAGVTRTAWECYCYQVLPVLGGKYETENFRVCDVMTQFGIWGPIHEKIKDLPDGAEVVFEVGE
jgi:hypothetical protein